MLPFLVLIETAAIFGTIYAGLLRWNGTFEQAFILTLCYITSFFYNDLYDFSAVRRFSDFLTKIPRAFAWGLILLAVSWGIFPDARIPAQALGIEVLLILAVLLPGRAAGYAVLRCRTFRERVLILGAGPMAWPISREIQSRPHLRFDVIGFVGNQTDSDSLTGGMTWLGETSSLDQVIKEYSPHRIIVAPAERRGEVPVRKLVEMRLNGIAVEDGEEFYEQLTGKVMLESLSPSSFVFGRRSGRTRVHLAIGRMTSMVVSAVGLALTAPLFPLIALAVRLDSPGPIFYVQDRVGRRGRRYRMLKFRTMRSVEREASAWAGDNGYRITTVGAWLRKFRLDELPQFVNILLGDMNLVGPRPHPVSNFPLFAEKIPQYELRLTVRPGVTGWAQTRYLYANNLEQETEKVRYDLYYIKHMSAWLDLRIIFDTIKVVLLGRRSDMTSPVSDPAHEGSRVHDTAA
ncbi:MAG TPA: sugar transferase [Patescibacteria group bacterium]|nr:sugar transferase [Patescibacteria group bacterium]